MENCRYVVLVFILCVVTTLLWPSFLFAYKVGTHAALTDKTVDFFNENFPALKLDDNAKMLMKNGSVDEDDSARFFHHFYDPVYERGLFGFSSSKEWAEATTEQGGLAAVGAGGVKEFFSTKDDYSWERAIYEYAWKDKKRGLETLGHILHLIQDASVPDHTRNDPHPTVLDWGSPYEMWTQKFEDGINLVGIENRSPAIFATLTDYFVSLAAYSNNNFFSKDTLPDVDKTYNSPIIEKTIIRKLSDGKFYEFAVTLNDVYFLARINNGDQLFRDEATKYAIEDRDNLILSDYWSRLSREAVLHGAGVIKLFFDEVEKEKQTKALYLKNRSWFQRIYDATRDSIFNATAALYGSSITLEDLEIDDENVKGNSAFAESRTLAVKPKPPLEIVDVIQPRIASPPVPSLIQELQSPQQQVIATQPPNIPFTLIAIPSGSFGAGGEPPRVIEPVVNQVATTTEAATSTPPVDTAPPAFTVAIPECVKSFSPSGCLITTTAITIYASSSAPDFARFEISCVTATTTCNNFPQTIATSTFTVTASLVNQAVHTFMISAFDLTGNATSTPKIIEVSTRPIVINEIAWAGTAASAFDEWIELYNPTGKDVSLAGWVLRADDGVPHISLSGTIPAKGYYLIERSDDSTISDIAADLITPFSGTGAGSGLEDLGERMKLDYFDGSATTTMDEVALCGPLERWCGGDVAIKWTLERYDALADGLNAENWDTHNDRIRNGKDANGAALQGTPRAKNSISYQIASGPTLAFDKILKKSESPYFVTSDNGLVIATGATLTIEPGVVIKMNNASGLPFVVNGTIRAQGTALEPIVFTSFHDDTYGGDLNGDGICNPIDASSTASCPAVGDWQNIIVGIPSQNSIFQNVIIRYGGRWYTNMLIRSSVIVDHASATFDAVTVEYSMKHGLYLDTSSSTITNSRFQNNAADNSSAGLFITRGAPSISNSNSLFSKNSLGLYLENVVIPLGDLQFSGNVIGLRITSASTTLTNSTFSGNGLDIQASGSYSVSCSIGCNASTTSPNPL